jgi:hypothetical protein
MMHDDAIWWAGSFAEVFPKESVRVGTVTEDGRDVEIPWYDEPFMETEGDYYIEIPWHNGTRRRLLDPYTVPQLLRDLGGNYK